MLAVSALAYVLDGRLLALGRSRSVRSAVVLTCLLAPVLTRAAPMGHPEEALAGALCALALLAALSGRPVWSGIALGAAVAAKPWAILAVLPALLAANDGRGRLLLVAGATVLAAELPFLLASPAGADGAVTTLSAAPGSFHPTQLFWPLREVLVDPVTGATGYRGPQAVHRLSHGGIVLLALPLSALFAVRLRARTGRARPTRSRCWRCCSSCAGSWTRGTRSTTSCPRSSPSCPGRRCRAPDCRSARWRSPR